MEAGLPPMFALIWFLSSGAAAPLRMTPVKVTDGVYRLEHSQRSGNSTLVITNDGVVVFDFHIDNADHTLAFMCHNPPSAVQQSQDERLRDRVPPRCRPFEMRPWIHERTSEPVVPVGHLRQEDL